MIGSLVEIYGQSQDSIFDPYLSKLEVYIVASAGDRSDVVLFVVLELNGACFTWNW